ncbi:MAG: phosphopantothenoylcysteine decarboxylase [Acidimicrobiales bacterium]
MHTEMWEHAAVQGTSPCCVSEAPTSLDRARADWPVATSERVALPIPSLSLLACLMRSPIKTSPACVVITAGGTRRIARSCSVHRQSFYGAKKQGYAIAEAARRHGASVTLIATIVRDHHPAITRVDVQNSSANVRRRRCHPATADIVVMTAAVADFRPTTVATSKIKKGSGVPQIQLERTIDILAAIGADPLPQQVLVGFAAETDDLLENAQRKLEAKGADFIVANDVSAAGAGFAHDTNQVTILRRGGQPIGLPLGSKSSVANALLDVVSDHIRSNGAPGTGATESLL